MSTIPTINPNLTMANINTKSKTTLNSNGNTYNSIAIKSNRNKGVISPFKADKQLLSTEVSRIGKDETRNNFTSIMQNLPQISKKTIRVKPPAQPVSITHKKTKRKQSIPTARMAQSVGPSVMNTEASTMHQDATTAANLTATNASVVKGAKSNSSYPDYFYQPKDNLFDSKRQSRYDKGQPKAFHLTQPDTNLAKFLFNHQENKKRQADSQSLNNVYQSPAGGAFASNGSIGQRSPRS